MKPLSDYRRRLRVIATVAVAGLLAATPAATALAAPSSPAASESGGFASALPVPVPIDQITPGLTGTGLTVSRGRTPEPFNVTVLGVLPGAIGAGVDMIVIEATSPAIQAAGGIWAGMSGSPVYTADGRLLGAVSYGFTAAPSTIGGMTPAVAMMELLAGTRTAAKAPSAKVPLPPDMSRKLVTAGQATDAQVAVGLEPLRIPLAVSGLNATRLARLNAQLEQSGSPMRAFAGSAATGSPAPAGALFPGSNFVAAVSYGDVTMAAIGTTTAVYGNKVLAFGHPMTFTGPVSMSAHQGTAIAVVKDTTFGSFKLATVDGVAGTVQQDRMVGLQARLGPGPRTVVPITSTVRSGTTTRTSTTWATMDAYAPDAAAQHLLSNIDRVFNRIGPGRATASWTIRGTSNGVPWQLSRNNRYASSYDIAQDSTFEAANQLYAILNNEFAQVKLTSITFDVTVSPDYGAYTVDGVLANQNGAWVELTSGVAMTSGQPLDLRVRLRSYRGTTRLVDFRLNVPSEPMVDCWLNVMGGASQSVGTPPATTFQQFLAGLSNAPRNNELASVLRYSGETGVQEVRQVVTLDEIVSGERSFPAWTS